MDKHLDQWILQFPRCNTLAWLIHQGAAKYGQRKWLNTNTGNTTYQMADLSSLQIAAFLKENGYHLSSYFFIDKDSPQACTVLLGGIKAGIAIVDERVHPPLVKQGFIDDKRLLVFEKNSFHDGKVSVDYRDAIKQGEKALFFNIPPTDETHNAFYFFDRDDSAGLQTNPVTHKAAVKQIYSSVTGKNLHPYIRIVYHWFNGFTAPV
jgi:hypothetical protein